MIKNFAFAIVVVTVLVGCSRPEADTGKKRVTPNAPATPTSTGVKATPDGTADIKKIADELKRQNDLAQKKAKLQQRELLLESTASKIASLVNDTHLKIGQAIVAAGGQANLNSAYNRLYSELLSILRADTLSIDDEREFRQRVADICDSWAKRQVYGP